MKNLKQSLVMGAALLVTLQANAADLVAEKVAHFESVVKQALPEMKQFVVYADCGGNAQLGNAQFNAILSKYSDILVLLVKRIDKVGNEVSLASASVAANIPKDGNLSCSGGADAIKKVYSDADIRLTTANNFLTATEKNKDQLLKKVQESGYQGPSPAKISQILSEVQKNFNANDVRTQFLGQICDKNKKVAATTLDHMVLELGQLKDDSAAIEAQVSANQAALKANSAAIKDCR